ncbi:hypothetical protein MTO96_016833 [Rhipicephalus appendiculatus]
MRKAVLIARSTSRNGGMPGLVRTARDAREVHCVIRRLPVSGVGGSAARGGLARGNVLVVTLAAGRGPCVSRLGPAKLVTDLHWQLAAYPSSLTGSSCARRPSRPSCTGAPAVGALDEPNLPTLKRATVPSWPRSQLSMRDNGSALHPIHRRGHFICAAKLLQPPFDVTLARRSH